MNVPFIAQWGRNLGEWPGDRRCEAVQGKDMTYDARLKECKRFVVLGLVMLAAGSAFLLVCKITASAFAGLASAVAGGACLLLGNGFIIYGLLIFCDARRS